VEWNKGVVCSESEIFAKNLSETPANVKKIII
jgi:hypothetical protein